MEIVEGEGGRYLRATNRSRLAVPLPETLPERFTVEFDYHQSAGHKQELSERRAASVKRFLIETYGIDESRLETAGFGESQPVAVNDTPEGKQKNRRVE